MNVHTHLYIFVQYLALASMIENKSCPTAKEKISKHQDLFMFRVGYIVQNTNEDSRKSCKNNSLLLKTKYTF